MYLVVSRFRRLVEPVVRGPSGILVTAAVFGVSAGIGGRTGVALASLWVLVSGTYCLANWWCCRETHCVLTGAGWTLVALVGLAAGVAPGGVLGWYRVDVLALLYLGILGAGYAFEGAVAARTGHHSLGVGKDGAEAR